MTGPFPRTTKVMALVILLVGVLAVFGNVADPRPMDFVSYWAAAVLALAGKAAAAYDVAAHQTVENGVTTIVGHMPFSYPPPFLILLLPLGLLPYTAAAGVWIAATYAAYLAAAHRFTGSAWLAAAFPPVLVNAIIGQSGLLTAALLIAAAISFPKRPLLAGLLLGCLVIKPQLAIFVPFALLAGRQWRALAGASLSSCGLLLLALLLFGAEPFAAMVRLSPVITSIVSQGLVGWEKMASVYASLRLAGATPGIAAALHLLVALAALAMTCVVWWRPYQIGAKTAVLVAASALASPYLYVHDTAMLIVPFAWLAAPDRYRWPLAILWCIPILSIAQSFGMPVTVDAMPLVPIGLLVLLARETIAQPPTVEHRREYPFGASSFQP